MGSRQNTYERPTAKIGAATDSCASMNLRRRFVGGCPDCDKMMECRTNHLDGTDQTDAVELAWRRAEGDGESNDCEVGGGTRWAQTQDPGALSKQYLAEGRSDEELTNPVGLGALDESTFVDPRGPDLDQVSRWKRSYEKASDAPDWQFMQIDSESKTVARPVKRICTKKAGGRIDVDRPRMRGNAKGATIRWRRACRYVSRAERIRDPLPLTVGTSKRSRAARRLVIQLDHRTAV